MKVLHLLINVGIFVNMLTTLLMHPHKLIDSHRRLSDITTEDGTKSDDLTHSVDVREMVTEHDKDNPLSELWDANHMRVTKQNVNLNMNVPLNRLKLLLGDEYRVKIIVHNDEDFNQLFDYFHPPIDGQEEPQEKGGHASGHKHKV